jgi:drug/metabolite transporter (DMT)-like permease
MPSSAQPAATPARQRLALAVALGLMLLWGSNYSVQKAVLAEIGPGALVFMRYLVTPACAVALLLWRHGWRWPRLERRDWLGLAGLAALGHVAHVNVMTQAMHLSTPFSSALISALGPMFTLLLVRLLHGERFTRLQVGGVALAMAGVLVFLSDKFALMRTQGLGDLLLLLAALLFSAHTVAATRLLSRLGVAVVMAYSTLLAMPLMLLINAPQALAVPWASLPAALWWALFWTLAVASFAGWLAWGWLNDHIGVPRTAPLLYLLPPVAGLISWLALGESFSALKIAGAVMAGVGVAATQFGAAAAASPASPLRQIPADGHRRQSR